MFNKLKKQWRKFYHGISLRNVIWFSFSITSIIATMVMGISFYSRFSSQLHKEVQSENEMIVGQVSAEISSHFRNMMKFSDVLYYNVLKEQDIIEDIRDIEHSFRLMYNSNKDYIKNIALFSEDGEALVLSPTSSISKKADVKEYSWFKTALEKSENLHFSTPHVQHIFDDNENNYEWVITLSRAVQISKGEDIIQGVLILDLTYSSIQQIFGKITLGQEGYLYITDSEGEIILHPKHQLITAGIEKENNIVASNYKDGIYEETFDGKDRIVTVKTVGYTGWIISGIVMKNAVTLNSTKNNLFIAFLFMFFIFVLTLINSYISSRVSNPIRSLEDAVKEIESGNLDAEINIEGFYEVSHLAASVENMAKQIKKLMDEAVKESEIKRKSELDSLQSQINPHFLYNTLDIVVWMIENEQKKEASRIITALGRFFRISLSRGKSIITVEDELEHVRNYLAIQSMRYKNRFDYKFEIEEGVGKYSTIKLILQPLVENAIYHGLEFMDGDGEIVIRAYVKEDDLYISVEDNGLGMPSEVKERLLEGKTKPYTTSLSGSGVGLINVNERIKVYYGKNYGLIVESEPDEGTKMIVHVPKNLYSSENSKEDKK